MPSHPIKLKCLSHCWQVGFQYLRCLHMCLDCWFKKKHVPACMKKYINFPWLICMNEQGNEEKKNNIPTLPVFVFILSFCVYCVCSFWWSCHTCCKVRTKNYNKEIKKKIASGTARNGCSKDTEIKIFQFFVTDGFDIYAAWLISQCWGQCRVIII